MLYSCQEIVSRRISVWAEKSAIFPLILALIEQNILSTWVGTNGSTIGIRVVDFGEVLHLSV